MSKLKSGRFCLTIIVGLVFAYVACLKIITPQVTGLIIVMVVKDYFQRTDRKNGGI